MECESRGGLKVVQERARELLRSRKLQECYTLVSEHLQSAAGQELVDGSDIAEAYNTRGQVKYLWVDFDGAVEDYSSALRHDPEFAVAYYNRGQIHYRMGRYQQAEADLKRALELQPNFPDAVTNLEQVQRDVASGRKFNVLSMSHTNP